MQLAGWPIVNLSIAQALGVVRQNAEKMGIRHLILSRAPRSEQPHIKIDSTCAPATVGTHCYWRLCFCDVPQPFSDEIATDKE